MSTMRVASIPFDGHYRWKITYSTVSAYPRRAKLQQRYLGFIWLTEATGIGLNDEDASRRALDKFYEQTNNYNTRKYNKDGSRAG